MKKKLVVLLAVVMMFAFSASAYAATFSDVSERPVVEQDAIKKAVALGIIEGYEDGTFGPDKTITRAEFAKIAVTAAGAKDTATMLEANASSFKDVKANSWYTGWINAGESLGIFKGDANGNFRPNDTISNQEAITVLMRLLGYNDNLTGAWPVNYVTKANQINILDDVNIVASAAAKRGDITVMLDATLDTDIVTYDKDTNEFVKKQTTKSGSSYITLLEDSFEGTFLSVGNFEPISQVRDVANKTLNWNVDYTYRDSEGKDRVNSATLIVDKDTAVSYNSNGLFDLENHQGKVYYVKGTDDKLYARFIEVESYTQTVTDPMKVNDTKTRVEVGRTSYNLAKNAKIDEGTAKNTNFTMYFDDDDRVYLGVSDQSFTERTFYVKSIGNNSVRLVGDYAKDADVKSPDSSKTVNMSDADTLIWDGDKFISPSELEVGDAVREIVPGDLYVKVADVTGSFTRYTNDNGKATIGGKSYVVPGAKPGDSKVSFYDEELEASDAVLDDVYGNNVRYILNKNNTIAAIIADETSTGATLYGIVVGGDSSSQYWGSGSTNSITLFTQEGNEVTYDFKKECNYYKLDPNGQNGRVELKSATPRDFMGRLVEYKLNAAGEIKEIILINADSTDNNLVFDATKKSEIKIKNNAYLEDNAGEGESYTLASNVVIFEVGEDKEDFDVSLITRSALLSGGDFTPEELKNVVLGYEGQNPIKKMLPYAVFDTNTSGAIKVLAYTTADTSNYHFGVVKAYNFKDADHTAGITLVGDDTVYDLGSGYTAKADWFIVYTMSGDEIRIKYAFPNDDKIEKHTRLVNGYTSGLISLDRNAAGWIATYDDSAVADDKKIESKRESDAGKNIYNIMTDTNTVVYIIDASTGNYEEGALSDISRNSHVYVPVIDKDGYADVVLVDEYTRYAGGNSSNSANQGSSSTAKDVEVKVYNNDSRYEAGIANQDNLGIEATYKLSGTELTITVYGARDVDGAIVAKVNGTTYTIKNGSNVITGISTVASVEVSVILNK